MEGIIELERRRVVPSPELILSLLLRTRRLRCGCSL
jgi:hypothetical protein